VKGRRGQGKGRGGGYTSGGGGEKFLPILRGVWKRTVGIFSKKIEMALRIEKKKLWEPVQ